MSSLPTRSGRVPDRALVWALPFLLASLAACLEYPDPAYGGAGGPAGAHGGEERPASTDAQATSEGAAPTYYGHRVYFDRWGRPMFYASGTWRYVPPSALGYAWYRQYWLRQRGAAARPEATTRPPATATPGGRSQTYSDFDPAPTSPPPARGRSTVPPPAPGEPDRQPPAGPGGL